MPKVFHYVVRRSEMKRKGDEEKEGEIEIEWEGER